MATDEFGGVAVAEAAPITDEFGGVPVQDEPQAPISGPNGWSTAGKGVVNSTSVGSIMRAFGEGFGEAWGPERLGLSKENTEYLSKAGIFAPAGAKHYENPFQAFNEGVIVNTAAALDAAWRTAGGVFRGGQAATMEAFGGGQFGRDIAAIPEAFMGSPRTLGEIRVRPGLPKDAVISPPDSATLHNVQMDVLHGFSKDAGFSGFRPLDEVSDESRYDGGGGVFGKQTYLDATGKWINGDNGPLGIDAAVRVTASFDKLFVLTPETIGELEKVVGKDTIQRGPDIAEALKAKGYDGIQVRGFDDHTGETGSIDPSILQDQVVSFAPEKGLKVSKDLGLPDRPTDATPEQAEAYFEQRRNILSRARDLGVIGPEKPPVSKGPPKEVAEKVVSRNADQPPGEKVTQELPGQQDPWQQRFEGFVSKLEAPDDVKQLIRDAAKENGDFMPARQGEIPLSHVEGIADAAGVAPEEINARGLGRKLQNDNEVRVAMQMMLQVTDDVKAAARDVKADGSPESMIKLQQAIMRRDLAVEQVVGLRAEWGRTGNVIQEFMRDVKDQQGLSDFLKGKGRTPADLTDIAHTIDALDRGQAARLLNDLRTPSTWDKFKFYWVNALISGPTTHAKYVVANAAFAAYESAVVTPVAGAIGTARRALTGGVEGVYMGEAAARTWGIVAGVPDALKAAVDAAKTGLQMPLPGEVAQNIVPKRNKNIAYQQAPIKSALGTIIGAPSRGASAIHSFFNFLGYRASIEAQAYRQAAKEGLKPVDEAFWRRRAEAADRPTPEMMNDAIEEGYKLTYISELGETGRKLSAFVNATKVGQLVMPFTHIPLNILKRALEGTPAAFLDAVTREELTGAKGAARQDTAIARMVVGSAVGAWAINQVLNERMTGFGPTDPKERAQWMATGHQPYSIRIGDYWYSFNRFGSLGTMLGLYSNLAEVIPHMKPDSEELTKAIGMAVHSTGRLMEDEVGMQGLAGLMDAINEPDRKGVRFVSNFAGSMLPYSSMQRQIASSMDPYMRETKSVVDGLRYYIPAARQGLLPKRDWSGLPVANAGYGGDTAVPGLSSVIQHRYGVSDPIALEMATLDLHPAPPQNRISGVKLPPKIYDAYQATAGVFTREALSHYIEQPGWHDLPPFVREKMFRATIEATRKSAAAATQMQFPEIIQQGVSDRLAKINGVKPTKLKDE